MTEDDGAHGDPGSAGEGSDPRSALSETGRATLRAIEAADGLDDLVVLTRADDAHEAYFEAKRVWGALQDALIDAEPDPAGVPATTVTLQGADFHVHGITHAGTDAERAFLRPAVTDWLEAGHAVFCEQGIRRLYFADIEPVRSMDDYRWAMARCAALEEPSYLADLLPDVAGDADRFDGLVEELDTAVDRFREAAFDLVDSGREVYGDAFASALGDVAADLLTSHETVATGRDFESFALTERAAADPAALVELQRYYRRSFLPQPIEREWLRRHDPELEVITHARNERLADYAVYHHDGEPAVHLVVGAAHQPGVAYYLEAIRDGEREVDFESVG